MLNQPVLFLDEIDLSDTPRVGPKAATLGRLKQSGLPVPNGFVIPATAFQRFILESELGKVVAQLEAVARTTPQSIAGSPLLEAVSDAFLHGQQFTQCSAELRRAFDALAGETGAVAVRSSAIAEDRVEASFAGQQLSVLNVRTFPDLLRAIWQTWASLYTPAAVQYRARFALGNDDPAMAVIVQSQVVCEAAGTMFTVDPVTGQGLIVVEAAWGLGEAIAQGEVVPDRYSIDRETLADARPAHRGDKRCQRVLNEHGGTRLASVPEWRRQDLVLSANQRSALSLLGLQVENILGGAQDIEWGLAGGRWWIFQSRPITARASSSVLNSSKLENFDWTSGFLDERLVEPVSPLGWSVLRAGLEEVAFRAPLRMLGVDLSAIEPLTRLWNGHPYTNVAVFESLYKLFPDWLLPEDARRFFPDGDVSRRSRARQPRSILSLAVWLGVAGGFFTDPAAASPIQNPITWIRFEREYRVSIAELHERIGALEAEARRGEPIDLAVALQLVDDVEGVNRRLLEIHRWSLTYAEILYSVLRRLAGHLFGPKAAGAFAAGVVQALGDESMKLNHALAKLAREGGDFESPAFRKRLDEFLGKYGHRSFSLDVLRPSFSVEPAQVLNLVQALRTEHPTGSLASSTPASSTAIFGQVLLWPIAFLTRRYTRLREDQRFAWQRGIALQRRLFLLIGQGLAQRGAIRQKDDVFFLTLAEIQEAARGDTGSLTELVSDRARRFAADTAHFETNPRASYPPFLHGNQPLLEPDDERRLDALGGVPVSPGIGRGPARVILRAEELAQVRPGEVLITRGADPGWTIIFGELAGLVTESGGQLSHAAVAAREFHLPAVLGVPAATEVIRTGDEVLVDGTAGQILILSKT